MSIRLPRAPSNDDELWWVIKALFGIELPRTAVCEGHSSPFAAVADAYFARAPGFAVWYASRGSGKSLALAVLGLVKLLVADSDVTILGGSIWQSQNVRTHMRKMLSHPNAPTYAIARDITSVIESSTGKMITPLPASQTSVRGPHPPLQLLDECDEMDYEIYSAALGQAMEQINSRGELLGEYIVASSTWQHPEGTFTKIIEDARDSGKPVHTWCWRELLAEHGGWMTRGYIDRKKATVTAQMWHTEYELNEPTAGDRAFDLDKVERYFTDYPEPVFQRHGGDDDEWVWEQPAGGIYAIGADWAKQKDYTVIAVMRYDVSPHRMVFLRRLHRRPYPVMIGIYNEQLARYNAVGEHDKTGVGVAVNDYIDDQTGSSGFTMIGIKRTQLINSYIIAFEHGRYELPRGAGPLYRAHRSTSIDDVYAPARAGAHLPDEVAAMALAHYAISGSPMAGLLPDTKSTTPVVRKVAEHLNKAPSDELTIVSGGVTIVDERYGSDTQVLWYDQDAPLGADPNFGTDPLWTPNPMF